MASDDFDLFQQFLEWKERRSGPSVGTPSEDVGCSLDTAEVIGGTESAAGGDDSANEHEIPEQADSVEGCSAEKYLSVRGKGKGKISTSESRKFRVSHLHTKFSLCVLVLI